MKYKIIIQDRNQVLQVKIVYKIFDWIEIDKIKAKKKSLKNNQVPKKINLKNFKELILKQKLIK
jgi:hypothetical protein